MYSFVCLGKQLSGNDSRCPILSYAALAHSCAQTTQTNKQRNNYNNNTQWDTIDESFSM